MPSRALRGSSTFSDAVSVSIRWLRRSAPSKSRNKGKNDLVGWAFASRDFDAKGVLAADRYPPGSVRQHGSTGRGSANAAWVRRDPYSRHPAAGGSWQLAVGDSDRLVPDRAEVTRPIAKQEFEDPIAGPCPQQAHMRRIAMTEPAQKASLVSAPFFYTGRHDRQTVFGKGKTCLERGSGRCLLSRCSTRSSALPNSPINRLCTSRASL